MHRQQLAWNAADIESFMQSYKKSDSLQFIGSSGVNRGWQTVLNNYKAGYPNKEAMGTLQFETERVQLLGQQHALLTGKYILTRTSGEVLSGWFTLIWENTPAGWRIISDHTSG